MGIAWYAPAIFLCAGGVTNSKVLDNTIISRGRAGQFDKGIKVSSGTSDSVFDGNTIQGSKTLDCEDLSTGGTGTLGTDNLWQNNKGKKAEPVGICS